MASAKKTTKEAPAKKKAAASKKEGVEKTKKVVAAKKESAPAAEKAPAAVAAGDRKGLAAKARSLKVELLAIRFNLQSPSLNEYRKKRRELAATLAALN